MVSKPETANERRPGLHSAIIAANRAARNNTRWKPTCFAPLKAWMAGCIPKLKRGGEDSKALMDVEVEDEESSDSDVCDDFAEGVEREESDMTNIYSHMRYLDDLDLGRGKDFLTDELYEMKIECIDFYLPQFVYASLKKEISPELQEFLLKESSQWMGLAIKMHWLYQAIVGDGVAVTGKEMHVEAARMMKACEEAVLAADKPLKDWPYDVVMPVFTKRHGGQSGRETVAFYVKAFNSDIVDYRLKRQLLMFQFQRYMFNTVTGAARSAKFSQMSNPLAEKPMRR
ncbi:Phosphatidylinositol 4-kinase beta [Perkinsus olseni]|uniref:Phosphatidylinositol 4-kinase beta n=1 Tax=Perkinsus olseni TaxID=32597 RepID=A0A7J6SKL3_PEROL|nr:Phosphatidylinositol 4-kinase beta [Perkinsus olseni]